MCCVRSIAIFCACLALSLGCEVVVFSPARRASRKLLERMVSCRLLTSHALLAANKCFCPQVEFIRVLDCEDRICEFNQEACRVEAFNGKKSLIRSFPSKPVSPQPLLYFLTHTFNLSVLSAGKVGVSIARLEQIQTLRTRAGGRRGPLPTRPRARTLEPTSHKPYSTSKCRSSEC